MNNNEMTGFDNFLDDESYAPEMETEYRNLPAGRVRARVESIEAKTFQMKDGRTSRALNVAYVIDPQFLPEEFQGGKDVKKYDTIWLDYDSQGRLASGTNMNLGLGRFRHATGTNSPMTLKQIVESAFQRTVELEISLEPDRKDPTQMRNNIKGVFPVAE